MRVTSRIFLLPLTAVLALGLLSACDFSEQNYDYTPGNTLAIDGATQVVVPDTTDYFVVAFTIEEEYTWTVNGEAPLNVRRGGEFIDVAFTEPGNYIIEVDNGEYIGTLEVTASEPEEEE